MVPHVSYPPARLRGGGTWVRLGQSSTLSGQLEAVPIKVEKLTKILNYVEMVSTHYKKKLIFSIKARRGLLNKIDASKTSHSVSQF